MHTSDELASRQLRADALKRYAKLRPRARSLRATARGFMQAARFRLQIGQPRGGPRRPRPRTRRITRTADSRAGPSDDDEPGGAGPPRLHLVDLSEELVEHVERRAKIDDADGAGPFASGDAA